MCVIILWVHAPGDGGEEKHGMEEMITSGQDVMSQSVTLIVNLQQK